MPKEVVYGAMSSRDDEGRPVCVLGWSREAGHVQVVTRVQECEVFFDEENPGAPVPVEYGYYVSLDRQGINAMIRNLRRARDQSFGRDE